MAAQNKLFQRLIWLVDDHPEEKEPRVYALDRVHDISETDIPFKLPKGFSASAFFDGCFGVDRSQSSQKIRISTGALTANFLRDQFRQDHLAALEMYR